VTAEDPAEYGRHIAEFYDDLYGEIEDTDEAVATLAELAAGGPVLEFGIGTGRLALPLAARAVEVHGIDASAEMVERLRGKPGGDAIGVTIGDFAEARAEGRFAVVVLSFNAIFQPLTQERQIRTLANAAGHLADGGLLVVEAFVPDAVRHRTGVHPRLLGTDRVEFSLFKHYPERQRLDTVLVRLTREGSWFFPANHRYAPPAELDAMARLAGCELRERWGGWARQPFTAASTKHVSLYAAASRSV
jgi:SAM-dependent methyltransferase